MNTKSKEETKRMIEVMQAHLEGRTILIKPKDSQESFLSPSPVWNWERYDYRVMPEGTKPSINWDHVHPEYNYLTADHSGDAWIYTEMPNLVEQGREWRVATGTCKQASGTFASYVPGTCDWRDSLIKRSEENK